MAAHRPTSARTSRHAFTMLELIVVIVVLGLLAAIAVVSFTGVTERSTVKVDQLSLAAVARSSAAITAVEQDSVEMNHVVEALEDCGNCTLDALGDGTFAAGTWRVVGHTYTGDSAPTADPGGDSSRAWTYGYILGAGWGTNEVHLVMASRSDGNFVHAIIRGYGTDVAAWHDKTPTPDGEPPVDDDDTMTTIPDSGAATETIQLADVLPPAGVPAGVTSSKTIDEHDADNAAQLDAGDVAPDATSIGGLTSMVSTAAGYPHRLLVADTGANQVTMVRQTGMAPTDVVATTFVTDIAGANALTVGPDATAAADTLVWYPLYVGSSADGGSIVRVDPLSRAKTTLTTSLGGAPTAFAGYACYATGSAIKTAGLCLYAAVGNTIHRVDLVTGSSAVWATLPAGTTITGLSFSADATPTMMVATATSTVTVPTSAAAGAAEVTGTAVTAPNGGGLTYVGANSPTHQGVWAAGAGGASRVGATGSVTQAGLIQAHYHGAANWLYGSTGSDVWWFDLGGTDKAQIWPTAPAAATWVDQSFAPADGGGAQSTLATTDADGNLYVGTTTSGDLAAPTQGGNDFAIVSYSPTGEVRWAEQFGSDWHDSTTGIAIGPDGNVYLSGQANGMINGGNPSYGRTLALASYTPDGTQRWIKQHTVVTESLAPSGLAIDSTGTLFVAGTTTTDYGFVGGGGRDVVLYRFDASGTQLSATEYGGPSSDFAYGVALDASGRAFVAIQTSGALAGKTPKGGTDIGVAAFSNTGAFQWAEQYGDTGNDRVFSIAADGGGNVYLTGDNLYAPLPGQTTLGDTDAFVVSFAGTGGAPRWVHQIGSDRGDTGESIHVGADGNVHVTGRTYGTWPGATAAGMEDVWRATYSTDGTQIAFEQFGTDQDDQGRAITTGSGGAIYVAGTSQGAFDGWSDNDGGNYSLFVSRRG